jgi:hypothetical protein
MRERIQASRESLGAIGKGKYQAPSPAHHPHPDEL